jgi:hypothetical protein
MRKDYTSGFQMLGKELFNEDRTPKLVLNTEFSAFKPTVYSKVQGDSLNSDLQSFKAQNNTRIESLISSNSIVDAKKNMIWCGDGQLCNIPEGKKGLNWGYGGSQIYDSGDLTLDTDDNIKFDIGQKNIARISQGGFKLNGKNTIAFGEGMQRGPNNGNIGYQTYTPDALDIVGAGTTVANRKTKVWGGLETDSLISGTALETRDGHVNARNRPLILNSNGSTYFRNTVGGDITKYKDNLEVQTNGNIVGQRFCIPGSYCLCKNPNNSNLGICGFDGSYSRDI